MRTIVALSLLCLCASAPLPSRWVSVDVVDAWWLYIGEVSGSRNESITHMASCTQSRCVLWLPVCPSECMCACVMLCEVWRVRGRAVSI